jgi:uncharacterized protein involved in copper resistance
MRELCSELKILFANRRVLAVLFHLLHDQAPSDAEPNATTDATTNAETDAETDAEPNATTDATTNAETDAETDAKTDTKADESPQVPQGFQASQNQGPHGPETVSEKYVCFVPR